MGEIGPYTPSEFRKEIRAAELLSAKMRPGAQAEDVLELFYLLDRLLEGYSRLNSLGIDLRAETTRLQTLHGLVSHAAPLIVRTLARRGGLDRLRARHTPSIEEWWWYLDRRVAAERARRFRRWLWSATGAAVLFAVLAVLYVRYLRPPEAVRLRHDFVYAAEAQLQKGDYVAALDSFQRALELAPEDPELSLMIGILYELLERPREAAESFARAEASYGDRALALSMRSQRYALLGQFDKSEADALEAVALDEQLALAYWSLGSAYEGQARTLEAIAAFRQCADKARQQEQNELYVIASTRLATLMQMPPRAVPLTPGTRPSSE
ncbi:MAG: tetratricopeptide repeat protein [Anaerolineae bacterium]|nr:tetratricopeptide repeat protein [Anaerolineae bacterium]